MIGSDNYFERLLSDEERQRLPYLETIPLLLEKCAKDYGEKTAFADDKKR